MQRFLVAASIPYVTLIFFFKWFSVFLNNRAIFSGVRVLDCFLSRPSIQLITKKETSNYTFKILNLTTEELFLTVCSPVNCLHQKMTHYGIFLFWPGEILRCRNLSTSLISRTSSFQSLSVGNLEYSAILLIRLSVKFSKVIWCKGTQTLFDHYRVLLSSVQRHSFLAFNLCSSILPSYDKSVSLWATQYCNFRFLSQGF